jgi:nucleoside-diphosphate-sugar epimerase
MKVALTGATGFIGSHILTELLEHGHSVTALVRDASHADTVANRGATATVVDLYDRAAVVGLLRDADAAIHTASPGDATSADLDSAVADAAIEAFAGSGKPYLQISGLWIYGNNPSVDEQSPIDSPPLVAWKEQIERRVLAAPDMRGVLIAPGVAYGDGGGGIPGLLLGSPRDDAGREPSRPRPEPSSPGPRRTQGSPRNFARGATARPRPVERPAAGRLAPANPHAP